MNDNHLFYRKGLLVAYYVIALKFWKYIQSDHGQIKRIFILLYICVGYSLNKLSPFIALIR